MWIKFPNRVWEVTFNGTIASRPVTRADKEDRAALLRTLGFSDILEKTVDNSDE